MITGPDEWLSLDALPVNNSDSDSDASCLLLYFFSCGSGNSCHVTCMLCEIAFSKKVYSSVNKRYVAKTVLFDCS